MPCWRPRSSIAGSSRWARPRPTWRRTGSTSGRPEPVDGAPLTCVGAFVRYRARVATTTKKTDEPPVIDEMQPISVLFDRVLVQISVGDGERRSRSGILIPATAQIARRLTWAEA